jgi:DNA-binding response OmpR family regulator
MDGFVAVKEIRNLGYTGLIFGVTGSSSEDDHDIFVESGADEVLVKPLDLKKLHEAIMKYSK